MIFLAGLVLEAFDDAEFSWVVHVLHDKPIHCLFIFPVHASCFNELALDLFDRFVVFGFEMADERIDHDETLDVLDAGGWTVARVRDNV